MLSCLPAFFLRGSCVVLAVFLSGCGEASGRILRVDPGGYHVRGDYIGAQRRVKLFIERIHAEPLRSGRGSLLVAKLVLLNERAEALLFDCVGAHVTIGEAHTPAVETHTIRVEAGELRRISLSFKTGEGIDDLEGGTLEIDGIAPDASGGKAPYRIPFSATEIDVHPAEKG